MDILWFAVAGSVLTIVFFRRELLIDRGSRKVICGVSVALFVAAICLTKFMRVNLLCFLRC